MNPPRVVALVPVFAARSETFYYRHIVALSRAADVTVFIRRRENEAEFPAAGMNVANISTPTGQRELALCRRAQRIIAHGAWPQRLGISELIRTAAKIRKIRPQVCYAMFVWNALDLVAACRIAGHRPRIVAHLGGSDVSSLRDASDAARTRARKFFRTADLLTVGSDFLERRALEAGAPPERVRRHYLGTEILPPGDAHHHEGIAVLSVGRMVPVKGHTRLIRAVVEARRRSGLPLRLDIVGGGPEQATCQRMIEDLDAGSYVNLHGALPHARVLQLITTCDIYAQHSAAVGSVEEGLGGTILEAQAAARPVVAVRSGGVAEAVCAESALLTDPHDDEGFIRNLMILAQDPAQRARLGAAGRSHVARVHNAMTQDELFVRMALGTP